MGLSVWKTGSAVCQSAKRCHRGLRAQHSPLHSRRQLSKEGKGEKSLCPKFPQSMALQKPGFLGMPKDTMGALHPPGWGGSGQGGKGGKRQAT